MFNSDELVYIRAALIVYRKHISNDQTLSPQNKKHISGITNHLIRRTFLLDREKEGGEQ